eukprot:2083552-Rhodomonas_salina.1
MAQNVAAASGGAEDGVGTDSTAKVSRKRAKSMHGDPKCRPKLVSISSSSRKLGDPKAPSKRGAAGPEEIGDGMVLQETFCDRRCGETVHIHRASEADTASWFGRFWSLGNHKAVYRIRLRASLPTSSSKSVSSRASELQQKATSDQVFYT